MKFRLNHLLIETKKDPVKIEFSRFNYYYGPISTGKSTISRLILYCLGRSMKETPALKNEFISAELSFDVEDFTIVAFRKKESTSLIVTYRNKKTNELLNLDVPAKLSSGSDLIPEKETKNMSDLVFYFANVEPPKVLESKLKENTRLTRLGFRDLFWYCYLEQEHMDNSFFYLGNEEDIDRRRKSRDALNYILGYYEEKVMELEKQLVEKRKEQISLFGSSQHLKQILDENNIESTNSINQQLSELRTELSNIQSEIKKTHSEVYSLHDNRLEKLKNERIYLFSSIDEITTEILSIRKQIEKQTQLQKEFLLASMKSDRTHIASQIFKKIMFQSCPKCGQEIKNDEVDTACNLCKQELSHNDFNTSINFELRERAKEYEQSIMGLRSEEKTLSQRLQMRNNQLNEIHKEIDGISNKEDSRFIQITKNLLDRQGILKGKIDTLERLLPLPMKVDDLENKGHELEGIISKIKSELTKARKEAEKNKTILDDLKTFFLDNLKRANFPEISDNYEVFINTETFYPYLKPKNGGSLEILEFFNAGSGGKKTLFKTCFALAVHRVSAKYHKLLPSVIMIDSPMKNIHKTEDAEIFQGFHKLLAELSTNELKDIQFIVIGSHPLPEDVDYGTNVTIRHFSRDIHSKYPPLIPYYEGQ